MKIAAPLTLAACLSAPAAIFTFDYAGLNATIPDNNLSGIADNRQISDSGIIAQIKVTLKIDSGSNGDLYVYLAHHDRISVLLNRVGRSESLPSGYTDPGLHITFSYDAPAGDIHAYRDTLFGNENQSLGSPLTSDIAGDWQPDGRLVSPLTATTDSARTATLNAFWGQQLQGEWTLFAADAESGQIAVLAGWGLQVTTVPEAEQTAIVSGSLVLAFAAWRFKSRKSH